jgi:hypothetical protein
MPSNGHPNEDTVEERIKIVKAFGKTFIPPFCQGTEWMPEDVYISPDHYGTWETKKWNHKGGKVILAGDSAHSMTPRKSILQVTDVIFPYLYMTVQGTDDQQTGRRGSTILFKMFSTSSLASKRRVQER